MSIYQVVAKGLAFNTDQLRNVHHFEFPSAVPDNPDLQALVNGLDTAYKFNLQDFFHDEIEFYAYDVRRVDVADLPSVEFIAGGEAWFGTANDDALPAQVSALVTWKTTTAYPRSTRAYLFPFAAGKLSAGGLIPTINMADIEAFAGDVLNITAPGAVDPIKVAVKYGGTPRVVTDSNEVTSYIVSRNYATQRRRKAGVGA